MWWRAWWKCAIQEISILLILNLIQLHCLNTRGPIVHHPQNTISNAETTQNTNMYFTLLYILTWPCYNTVTFNLYQPQSIAIYRAQEQGCGSFPFLLIIALLNVKMTDQSLLQSSLSFSVTSFLKSIEWIMDWGALC